MTNDREYLELAAKAAGIPLRDLNDRWDNWEPEPVRIHRGWNPLTDDGDALRLAVKLEIDISLYAEKGGRVYAQTKHLLGLGTDGEPSYQAHDYMKEEYEEDPYAATRRAIVRAAAELGRSMK